MKQLTPQSIAIVGLLTLALIVGGAGYFMVIGPQASKKQGLAAQMLVAQAQLTAAQGLNARPVPFRASDLFRLAKAMPGSDDMPGILLDLRNVAKASSVQLTSIHPTPRIVLPLGYSALPLSVVVSGKYDAVSDFLGRLRKDVHFDSGHLTVNGRLFLADQIALQAGTKNDMVSATLSLDAFVFAAPAPVSATAGASGSATTTSTTTTASGSAG